MTKVARFEGYRGFLFGSLNPDVLPLTEHLGDTTTVIDMLVDQSPDGLEVLRGASTYTYDGNWKVQAENGADGYHVTATHWNYAATTSRRTCGESKNDTKALDAGSWGKSGGGYWRSPTGTCACGPGPPTRRTVPCGTGSTSSRPDSAMPRANSWSRAHATCACTRTST
jgi:benzoate/toluate 1,2-dioxygenase alpha subunit